MRSLCLILIFLCNLSFGQSETKNRMGLNSSIGGNYTTGNTNNIQFLSKLGLSTNPKNEKIGIVISGDYFLQTTKQPNLQRIKKNEDIRAEAFTWVGLGRDKNKNSWITFTDFEHSFVKGIDARYSIGSGIKHKNSLFNSNLSSSSSIALIADQTIIRSKKVNSMKASIRQSFQTKILGTDIRGHALLQSALITKPYNVSPYKNSNVNLLLEVSRKISENASIGIIFENWTVTLPSYLDTSIRPSDNRFVLNFKIAL